MMDRINRIFLGIKLRLQPEEGQTFVEYALIGVFVAVIVAVAAATLGTDLVKAFGNISKSLGLS